MVNQDILSALKSAVIRGHSLEAAMQTLLNTGYPQNQVQEAAQFLKSGELPEESPQPKQQVQQTQPEKTPQKVSSYEEIHKRVVQNQNTKKVKESSKILVITLIIILAILLGVLIGFFIFKDQIIEIFS